MSIHLPSDTSQATRAAAICDNRSLFAARFAFPDARDDKDATPRKDWFHRLMGTSVSVRCPSTHWLPPNALLLHGQLQSRLLINMAGGVMENAGLQLDRYGLPLIPGSSVKGCARRASLAALREWCVTGTKPEGDNLLALLCHKSPTPSELLVQLCLVFGWVEQDWSTGKNQDDSWESDIAWACDGAGNVWRQTATTLAQGLHIQIKDEMQPWESLPAFAGLIAFLQSSPNRDPGLVLDVLTPHHAKYYESTDPHAVATDTEEPVPVFFPAIKEQGKNDYFTFPMIPLHGAEEAHLQFAKSSLRVGLETFGLGAKTNAGYGWFDASEQLNADIAAKIAEDIHRKALQDQREREKAIVEQEAREKAEARAILEAALKDLTPEQQEDKKLELLTEAQFDSKVRAFCKSAKKGGPTDPEKQAIVRALRGPREAYWQAFKQKSTKGELATVEQTIRQISNTLNLGKMP